MMNDITLDEIYSPVQAIMIYQSTNSKQYYLEAHEVFESGRNKIELREGCPLKRETIIDMVNAMAEGITEESECDGILPECVLYFKQDAGNNILIWHRPSHDQQMFFSKALHLKDGIANVPAMLYVAKNEELFVYALKNNVRPSEKTRLYSAPFHNVNCNGLVCQGQASSIRKKNNSIQESIKMWEKIWWKSEFSEIHDKPIGGNLNTFWKNLISSGSPFPKSKLLDGNKKTFKQLLNSLK